MSFKCPDCGASLTDDSRFCKYCGAKIDDGVKRSEVKIDINKRIEDVAEIRRAGYEERESNLRVKKMERELRAQKAKRIAYIVLLVLAIGWVILGLSIEEGGVTAFIGGLGVMGVLAGIISQLIQGKW